MKQVEKISIAELSEMAQKMYGTIVKADIDLVKGTLLVDMEMHADGEAYLIEQGSKQTDLWGFNLHPDKYGSDDFIEFDSMINIRPRQNNPTRDILDEDVRNKIWAKVSEVVYE
ncbi:MAG TPA: DUF5674 family protein [Candidatus Saccharimonadales bacterium]|nr:DUF5674 family protein [Candidatus Saccharimonadales bacterium]